MGKPRQCARRGASPIAIAAALVIVAVALTALFVVTRPPELPEVDVRAGDTLYSVGADGVDGNAADARSWYLERGVYDAGADTLLAPGVPAWERPSNR